MHKADKSILIAVLFLSLVLAESAFGQGFVSEENQWNVLIYDYYYGSNTEIFKIEGDSLLNSITYKKIWWSHDTAMAFWTYQGLLREDSNIVYYIPPDGTEGVLYNFNLEKGDTCRIKNVFCGDYEILVEIEDLDTLEYFGIERKRWTLDTPSNGFPEFWIEGIGSTFGPLYSKYYECIVCPTWDLLCYHENNSVLYMMPGMDTCYVYSVGMQEIESSEQITIYPNPARDKFEVRSAEFGVDLVEIFDMSGRKVLEKQLVAGTKEFEVKISRLIPGSYLCSFSSGGQKLNRKILIR